MQRNIIVQQGRINPNDERFDLSIKYKPTNPSKSKTQYVFHPKPVFDELELVKEINTTYKFSQR